MSFEVCFTDPFLDDVAESNPLVPQFMEVTIANRAYVLDTSFEPYRRDAFRHRSIQPQRESISLDNIPGEGTVNTEGLWRRLAQDWSKGAGQPYQDRKDSIDSRFSTSKGFNPWMQWEGQLLDDTELVTTVGAEAQVVQCGPCVYVLDVQEQIVKFTTDLLNWTTVSGLPGAGMISMTTDGFNLWVSANLIYEGAGIYTTTAGAAAATLYVDGTPYDNVYYVGDRLMATWENNVYNITAPGGEILMGMLTAGLTSGSPVTSLSVTGTLLYDIPAGQLVTVDYAPGVVSQNFTTTTNTPAGSTTISVTSLNAVYSFPIGSTVSWFANSPQPLWTHPNGWFRFSAMCAGSSQIYIAGYVPGGNQPLQSTVYRTTIEATGTALTIPVQALPMEGGEYATSLYGYLNYIFVGSNLGLRMCRTIAAFDPTGNEGDLEAGPLIPGLFPPGPVNSPVFAITGNNRFVYFGWNNYDSVSTGLGRCDLSTFIDTQSPAFASDLMATTQGLVTSMDWCTISNSPMFVVQGVGLYTGTNTPVQSGYVTSGYLGFDIPDDKIVLAGDIGTVQPQPGTASMALASDAAANIFAFVGSQTPSKSPILSVFPIPAVRGELFTVKMTLTRDAVTHQSPVMHRWMIKAIPAITAGTTVSVVIRMWNVEEIAGEDYFFDPYAEKQFLENLRTTQTVFAYNEGPLTYENCTIDEIDWLPEKRWDANAYGGFVGDIIVYLKTYDLGA